MSERQDPHAKPACGAPGLATKPVETKSVSDVSERSRGTFPDGAESEADASRKVREMFSRIAPRYDLLNHLLSLELDRLWRARTARILAPILEREDARVLDLCCGTGDLAFALQRRARARLFGADFSHTMLTLAKEKVGRRVDSRQLKVERGEPNAEAQRHPREGIAKGEWPVQFVEADGLGLPFADGVFDLVTTAWGFRNLANYEAGLTEIRRVLKPGGTLAILECTEPKPGWFGDLFRWYFRTILPKVGRWISGDKAAYSYLPDSVARFLRAQELAELMRRNGFTEVEARTWTGGTVALHIGQKTS